MKRHSGYHEDVLKLNYAQRDEALKLSIRWYNRNVFDEAMYDEMEEAYYATPLEHLTPEEEDAVCDFIEGVPAKTNNERLHLRKGLYKLALAKELNKLYDAN